jgi:hypothetical protein
MKMDLREMGWGCLNRIELPQDRGLWKSIVNTVMNLWVPYNVGKLMSSCTTGGLSRTAQFRAVSPSS